MEEGFQYELLLNFCIDGSAKQWANIVRWQLRWFKYE